MDIPGGALQEKLKGEKLRSQTESTLRYSTTNKATIHHSPPRPPLPYTENRARGNLQKQHRGPSHPGGGSAGIWREQGGIKAHYCVSVAP